MKPKGHIPVLLQEVLKVLRPGTPHMPPTRGKVFVDCTVGLGGHSAELLARLLPPGQLIGMDLDPAAIAVADQKLSAVAPRKNFTLFQRNFAAIQSALAELGSDGQLLLADGILADLGVSSPQIDHADRGFSYRQPGPLDMRMDPSRGQPASVILARLSEQEIAEALLELGDETDAPLIAKLIVERRKTKPIETTQELTAVICQARRFTLERAAGAKLHPAARSFQALRILVNRELANLDRLLAVLPECLAPRGVAAIITFHSGEDRRVKKSFIEGKRAGLYSEIAPDPLRASEEEIRANSRAKSAKLRWAVRSPAR